MAINWDWHANIRTNNLSTLITHRAISNFAGRFAAARIGAIVGFFAALLSPTTLVYGQTTLFLSLGADEESSQSQSITFQHRGESGAGVALYGSKSDDSASSADLSSSTKGIHFSIPLDDIFNAGLGYERWGNSGDFTIRTLSMELSAQGENWSISFRPRIREVEVITGRTAAIFRRLENGIDSTGLNVRLGYEGAENMSASIFYSKDQYDWDFSGLDLTSRPWLAGIFSPVTISLAQGLEDYSFGVDLGFYYQVGFWGVEWSQSRSVVTDDDTQTVIVYSSMGLGEHWSIGLDIGSQSAETGGNLLFGSVGLGYAW